MQRFSALDLSGLFQKTAADIYSGRYTQAYCEKLAGMLEEARGIIEKEHILLLVHNYQYPELQELARAAGGYIGDSYGLTMKAKETSARTVVFCSVYFMAETAKILLPDRRVLVPARPGCSLADSVDLGWLKTWKKNHPGGKAVSYINTTAPVKAESDFICTSRNAPAVVARVRREFPGSPIVFLPDKYLAAHVMRTLAMKPGDMDIWPGACHVHQSLNEQMIDAASEEHPEAELLIHPECGCTSSCLARVSCGVGYGVRFLSTEGMLQQAAGSATQEFVVATEAGMVYRLRRDIPEKTFWAVSPQAHCCYMKEITLEGLLSCLRNLDNPAYEVLVPEDIASPARTAIEAGMAIS